MTKHCHGLSPWLSETRADAWAHFDETDADIATLGTKLRTPARPSASSQSRSANGHNLILRAKKENCQN